MIAAYLLELIIEHENTVGTLSLNDVERIIAQPILLHTLFGSSLGGVGYLPSHCHYIEHLIFLVNFTRKNLSARLRQLGLDKRVQLVVEDTATHNPHRHERCGNHRDDGYSGNNTLRLLSQSWILELKTMEMHQTHTNIGGKTDEYRIDEEEIECSEEIKEMTCGKTISCCTQRRHEGSGNSHTRDDITLALGAESKNAGSTTKGGNEHVVDSGRSARKQFRLCLAQWCDNKIHHRRENTDESGHTEVFHRTTHKIEVVDTHRQSHTNDRTHERGYQHGTDNHRRGIDIQSERSDENSKDEHPQIGTTETHSTCDLIDYLLFVFHVLHDDEMSLDFA